MNYVTLLFFDQCFRSKSFLAFAAPFATERAVGFRFVQYKAALITASADRCLISFADAETFG